MTDPLKNGPELARLTADAVIFGEEDGTTHVLMIERLHEPYVGHLALPGGFVDAGEDTADAARRELREETGLDLPGLMLVGTYAAPGRDPRGRVVTFAYLGRVDGLPEPTAGDDAKSAWWIPISQVVSSPTAFDHQRIIRDALGRFAISEGTDTSADVTDAAGDLTTIGGARS